MRLVAWLLLVSSAAAACGGSAEEPRDAAESIAGAMDASTAFRFEMFSAEVRLDGEPHRYGLFADVRPGAHELSVEWSLDHGGDSSGAEIFVDTVLFVDRITETAHASSSVSAPASSSGRTEVVEVMPIDIVAAGGHCLLLVTSVVAVLGSEVVSDSSQAAYAIDGSGGAASSRCELESQAVAPAPPWQELAGPDLDCGSGRILPAVLPSDTATASAMSDPLRVSPMPPMSVGEVLAEVIPCADAPTLFVVVPLDVRGRIQACCFDWLAVPAVGGSLLESPLDLEPGVWSPLVLSDLASTDPVTGRLFTPIGFVPVEVLGGGG